MSEDLPPIILKKITHIIDRVYERYPVVKKSDITVVILTLFNVIRKLLITNKIVSINGLFNHAVMIEYIHITSNKISIVRKIKLKTPEDMR